MLRYLKYSFLLFATALIITLGFVTLVLDKASYKKIFVQQLQKSLHRELDINGEVEFSLLPELVITLNHPTLANPSGFSPKTFAEAEKISFVIQWLPLLHGHLEVSCIKAYQLKLYLTKNTAGKANWQDLLKGSGAAVSIPALHLTESMISYTDKNQRLLVSELNLHREASLVTNPGLLDLAFKYETNESSGKINLSAYTSVEWLRPRLLIEKISCKAVIDNKPLSFQLSVTGQGALDFTKQELSLEGLAGKIYNLKFSGELSLNDLGKHPLPKGHFIVQADDFRLWLKTVGIPVENLKELENLKGEINLRPEDWQGSFAIETLKLDKLKLQKLKVHAVLENKELSLSSIEADLYGGQLQGNMKVHLQAKVPSFELQAKASQVDAKALLNELAPDSSLKFSGKGDLDLKLTSSGSTAEALLDNLKGEGKINFKNGEVGGLDILYWMFSGFAILNNGTAPSVDSKRTQYADLTASFQLAKGVMSNQDLLLATPYYKVEGNGDLDFAKGTINYRLAAMMAPKSSTLDEQIKSLITHLFYDEDQATKAADNEAKIPILIAGRLTNPQIGLDMKQLLGDIALMSLRQALKKQVEKT